MDYLRVQQLMSAGRYHDLRTLLEGDFFLRKLSPDPAQLSLLQAACHLAQSCESARQQADLHRGACQQAQQQEVEQLARLESLLQLMLTAENALDDAAPFNLVSSQWAPTRYLSFWQRLKQRLLPPPNGAPTTIITLELPAGSQAPAATSALEPAPLPIEYKPEPIPWQPPSPIAAAPAPLPQNSAPNRLAPSLTIYCLGHFRVFHNDKPIEKWPSSKGKCILKYMVLHRQNGVPKDLLMDVFWPDADPEAARNNLNVAIHGLRKALRHDSDEFSHILFEEDCYLLNPAMKLWVDVEDFGHYFTKAQELVAGQHLADAITELLTAEALYLGELLVEDRYEEWILPYRQELQSNYLHILEELCKHFFTVEEYLALDSFSRKLLAVEPCHELAHRRLMRAFCRRRHPHLALRQYHLCCQALARELDVEPEEETQQLYEKIRQQLPV